MANLHPDIASVGKGTGKGKVRGGRSVPGSALLVFDTGHEAPRIQPFLSHKTTRPVVPDKGCTCMQCPIFPSLFRHPHFRSSGFYMLMSSSVRAVDGYRVVRVLAASTEREKVTIYTFAHHLPQSPNCSFYAAREDTHPVREHQSRLIPPDLKVSKGL